MYKVFSSIIFFILLFNLTSVGELKAQQYGFEIVMESDYDEVPSRFTLNDAGDFVGLVSKAPPPDSIYIYDTYLYKISPIGDTISIKFTKEDTVYNFFYINKLTTEPKGFLLSGWGHKIGEDPNNKRFVILRRIDDNLDLVWEKVFMFNYYFAVTKSTVLELINGDIVYACSPHSSAEMFLLKLTAFGDSINFAHYTGTDAGEVFGLTYSPDSTNIWLHNQWAHYTGTGSSLCSCIVLNNKLEQVGVKHYPEYFRPPFGALLYNDSLLLAGGSDIIYNIGLQSKSSESMICAYMLDTTFNIKHEVHLTNPDTNSRAAESSNCIDFYHSSCIYLGGNHNIQDILGIEPSWFYITKLNDTLGVEYERYIGGDDYYVLFNVTAAADGGVLLTGTRQEPNMSYLERDGFIIKLDSTGCITGIPENSSITISDAIIYPNPGSNVINVRTALKGCVFHLYDNWGRPILSRPLLNNITSISTNTISKGNYYYTVNIKEKTIISGIWIKN